MKKKASKKTSTSITEDKASDVIPVTREMTEEEFENPALETVSDLS